MQYVLIVGVLAIVNLVRSPTKPWFILVAICWGTGLVVHALIAFDVIQFLGPAWERREIEKRLARKR